MSNFIHQREALLLLRLQASTVEVVEAELTDLISELDGNIEECEEELPLWKLTLLPT